MTPHEALERLLPSYGRYYDVLPEAPAPFAAAAEFHSHGESYMLVKSAKLWEMDSNEFVYFAAEDALTADAAAERIEKAWALSRDRINPDKNHRNSDVTVIFLADTLDDGARSAVRHTVRSVGYHHGLHGWSNLRLGAIELSTGRVTTNRHGRDLEKLLRNISNSKKIGE